MKITDADLASGIAFLTLAAGFGIPAFGYGLGTTLRLGPGAFPLVLSVLLGIVGGCLVLRSLAGHRGEPIKPIDLRAAFMIILALCFGALTMRNVGILVAVPGAIIIAASHRALQDSAGPMVLPGAGRLYLAGLRESLAGSPAASGGDFLMDWFANLGGGFLTALSLQNTFLCFVGVMLGTAIGVLPGVGPLVTIAILLPLTYALEPTSALIMLSGIYYGAQYGGSTTAILVNLPGESSSVVTCIDGHQMARRGRAGSALAIAALGSFFAGTVGTLMIAAFSPYLSKVALSFSPAAYFSLMVLGLVAAITLASGGLLKAVGMMLIGLLLGMVGTDLTTGTPRYTFGTFELLDGIEFTALAMGVFAFGDVMANASRADDRSLVDTRISRLWPTREEFREAWPAVLRGTGLGSVLGLLPGGGATLSSFTAYSIEKKLSGRPRTSARAPSRAWPRPRLPTMPARRVRSSRCLRSAFRQMVSWR